MKSYCWLLFDADGTLFDYDKAEAMALQKTFESFGFPYQAEYTQIYRQINDQFWQAFERGEVTQVDLRTKRFSALFEIIQIDIDPTFFSASYLRNLGQGDYLLDGTEETLAVLYGKVGLMLITNGLKEVQRSRLAKSTITHYFADVIISDEVGSAKPDARIFEVAFEKMGNPDKQDVLIIGDSLTSDIQGGNRFGIYTCWFNPNRRPRDQDVIIHFEIRHLSELLPVIGLSKNI